MSAQIISFGHRGFQISDMQNQATAMLKHGIRSKQSMVAEIIKRQAEIVKLTHALFAEFDEIEDRKNELQNQLQEEVYVLSEIECA